MSSDFKSGILRFRGRYWQDAESARMLRHENEDALEFNDTREPLVAIRRHYEYAPSGYGITAPKRIVVDLFLDSGGRRAARAVSAAIAVSHTNTARSGASV